MVFRASIGQTNDVKHKKMMFKIDIHNFSSDYASQKGSNNQKFRGDFKKKKEFVNQTDKIFNDNDSLLHGSMR